MFGVRGFRGTGFLVGVFEVRGFVFAVRCFRGTGFQVRVFEVQGFAFGFGLRGGFRLRVLDSGFRVSAVSRFRVEG